MNELSNLEALVTSMAPASEGARDILARLNKEQTEAVCQKWGPSLIVAGAGSGKTTVLTRRVAFLIKERRQSSDSIMAVTFTNKAAKEMKDRIETIIGADRARFSWIGTFHSICARLLRREIGNYTTPEGWKWTNNFVIYDETDSLSVMKQALKNLNLDEKVFPAKEVRHAISSLKNDGYTYDLYAQEALAYKESKICELFGAYQKELARNDALDFDDLILVFTDLLKRNPDVRARLMWKFQHLLIDEFQDTNKSQYEFVRLLGDVLYEPAQGVAAKSQAFKTMTEEELAQKWEERSLMVVGDVDQSIYSWRKADYKIFLGFQSDFPNCQIIKLEENYRSTSTILDIANSIISNNVERLEKTLRCNRPKGAKAQYFEGQDQIDEAFYVVEELKRLKVRGRNYSDSTILYRTNSQSRAIEEVLIRSGVPYTVIGGTKFYDRQEIKDMIAYLKLVFNPKDGQAFNRVVNQPKRGIGKTSLDRIAAYAQQRGISTMEAALEAHRISNLPAKAITALSHFASSLFSRWQPRSKPERTDEATGKTSGYKDPISGLLQMILADTGYMAMLENEALLQKDELSLGRIENVRELVAVAREFEDIADEPDLESFLTRVSLVSDLDNVETGSEAVRLMTLHSAKGLEFPVVFIMGLEEGILPHSRSFDSLSGMEEERRLMYVGVTRAEDLLYLTRARKRTFIVRTEGQSGFSASQMIPSRFLKEITPGLLTGYTPGAGEYEEDTGYGYGYGYDQDRGSRGGYGGGGRAKYDYDRDQNYSDSYGSRGGYDRSNGSSYDRSGGGGSYGRSNGSNDRSSSGGSRSSNGNYGNVNRSGAGRSGAAGGRSNGGTANGAFVNGQSGQKANGAGSSFQQRREGLRAYSENGPGSGIRPPGGDVKPRAQRIQRSDYHDGYQEALKRKEASDTSNDFEKLVAGDSVQHSKFGIGKVVSVLGEGDKELYNIDFGANGKRIMDPKFAKLIKLS